MILILKDSLRSDLNGIECDDEEQDISYEKPTLDTLMKYKPSEKKDEIYNQMVYKYPDEQLLNIAAKQSVSEIKRVI